MDTVSLHKATLFFPKQSAFETSMKTAKSTPYLARSSIFFLSKFLAKRRHLNKVEKKKKRKKKDSEVEL